jgi:hypothetical protein
MARRTGSQGERDMQLAHGIRSAQCVETRLHLAMDRIWQNQEGLVEKHLLRLRLADRVLVSTLPRVTVIPIETIYFSPVNH